MDPGARWIGILYGGAYLVAAVWVGVSKLRERKRRPAPAAHVGEVGGFWDYQADPREPYGLMHVVVVDQDGAGRLACAQPAGGQLKHLTCPLAGPCTFEMEHQQQ